MAEKLKLGENHRRVVSVLLRGVEHACDEIDAALHDSPGTLCRVDDDLTAAQRPLLQEMINSARGEIRRLAAEIELDTSVGSQRRTILALLSASVPAGPGALAGQ